MLFVLVRVEEKHEELREKERNAERGFYIMAYF